MRKQGGIMKLIDEIIELLSSDEPNLNNALFKTKVLMHKLGVKDSMKWIDSELKGYSDESPVPEYRKLKMVIKANISNGAYRHTSQPAVLHHLPEDLREHLENNELRQSIVVIESFTKDEKDIAISIPPVFYGKLSEAYSGGYTVERAWGKNGVGATLQIVNEVRTRLLDFVLKLTDEFSEVEEGVADVKEISKEANVSDMFKNAVFGPNATIVVGDHNKQSISNNITTNDFESLASELRKLSIVESDIQELKEAIDNDQSSVEFTKRELGQNVGKWIASMVAKAAGLTWDVNVGAAGSLLGAAIGTYYGWM